MADEPNLGRPEQPPPPRPVMFAGFSLAFAASTTIALVMDRCDVGIVLSIPTLLFASATFFFLLGSNSRVIPYSGPSLAAKEKERTPSEDGPNDPTYRR